MRFLGRTIFAISVSVMIATSAVAQQKKPAAPFPNPSQLVNRSRYIFSGTVIRVQRTSAPENAIASTQITFRVDEGIQGVRSGEIFTVREWSGLWDSGERYWPAERVLLFLYPPSKLGFTSPVEGALGRFEIDHVGKIRVNEAQQTLFSATQPGFSRGTRVSLRDFARAVRESRNEHEQIR